MNIYGIAIIGANGSGKTTLGAALAKTLQFNHMDIEDYAFKPSSVPYSAPRTKEETQELLLKDIRHYKKFILSSVNGDFDSEINSFYKYVIYLKAPLEIRMKRVKQRAFNQFGDRMTKGGDLYEQEQKFFQYVKTRTMEKTEDWLKTVTCPIIFLDGTKPIEQNIKIIQNKINLKQKACI